MEVVGQCTAIVVPCFTAVVASEHVDCDFNLFVSRVFRVWSLAQPASFAALPFHLRIDFGVRRVPLLTALSWSGGYFSFLANSALALGFVSSPLFIALSTFVTIDFVGGLCFEER